MKSINAEVQTLVARGAALLLCVLWLPVWLAQSAAAIRTGRSAMPTLKLWPVVRGELAFVGPPVVEGLPRVRPGLISPGALRRRMGIAHVVSPDDDLQFFANATVKERINLLLRYAWSGLLSGDRVTQGGETSLFGVRIDGLTMRSAVGWILDACSSPKNGRTKIVAFVNPDCLNKAFVDPDYHHLLNRTDLVLPDGSGLRIAARLLRLPLVDNVNGTDLFPLLCESAEMAGKKLFLFGGQPGVALEVAARMRAKYPGLLIVGCLDGYSHRAHPSAVTRAVNASGADIVLVGLGAPRQERWLHEHREHLNSAVGIGVGGLFDYYSGRIRRAPLWLREAGLEWVWRILQEPRAKWRRYVAGNPLFLMRVLRERALRRGLPAEQFESDPPQSPSEWAAGNAASANTGVHRASSVHRRWRFSLVARRAAKRTLDVAVAGIALVALSPLLLATAVLIRLESPGPVFFCQPRVGRRGSVFPMFKFRSMYIGAEQRLSELEAKNESAGGVLFKMRNDPRITRVGRFIRRYSIDELPQLINVLRGEMSIVGPRPALSSEVENYSAADRKRLQAKPGLTCLWQIGGRSDLSFEQQVELDVDYLKRQNVLTDLGIMAKTVPAVITGKGAY